MTFPRIAFLLALFLTTFGLGVISKRLVYADGSGSAIVAADAPPIVAVVKTPADALHDPLTAPAATFDDLKAAKKLGWPALVFAIVIVVARVAGSVGKSIPFLAKLATGKVAVVVAGVLALGLAAYNTAASGGSAVAIGTAAILAIATFWNSHAEWAPPPKQSWAPPNRRDP